MLCFHQITKSYLGSKYCDLLSDSYIPDKLTLERKVYLGLHKKTTGKRVKILLGHLYLAFHTYFAAFHLNYLDRLLIKLLNNVATRRGCLDAKFSKL